MVTLIASCTYEKLGRDGSAVSFFQQGVAKDGLAGLARPD